MSRRLGAGFLAVLALVLMTGCGAADDGDDVFSIVVGDCLDDADVPDEVTTLPIVDCAEPHDSEVFARTEATGTTFPGDDVLQGMLAEFCRGDAFTEFVGLPFVESRYATRGYYPTAESWANGDRELLCTVVDESGAQLTGSLAGVDE